jgi:hypothetical protein
VGFPAEEAARPASLAQANPVTHEGENPMKVIKLLAVACLAIAAFAARSASARAGEFAQFQSPASPVEPNTETTARLGGNCYVGGRGMRSSITGGLKNLSELENNSDNQHETNSDNTPFYGQIQLKARL